MAFAWYCPAVSSYSLGLANILNKPKKIQSLRYLVSQIGTQYVHITDHNVIEGLTFLVLERMLGENHSKNV